jgi:P-type Ca2+ transporter type 2C
MQIPNIFWYNLSKEAAIENLKSDPTGLTSIDVENRAKESGKNELPSDKKLTGLRIFLRQFKNVLMYILLAAALISLALSEFVDFGIIVAAILINTIVGFIQENKAENALSKLRQTVVLDSKVIRDGQVQVINSVDLVPGDIILLEAGDQVPADARLLEVNNFQTSEALLTGESSAVVKVIEALSEDKSKKTLVAEQKNMVFKGSLVVEGKGKALVTGIGLETEVGKIANLLKTTKDEETPLQKQLSEFSKKLGLAVLLLAAVIVVIGVIQGKDFWEIFLVSVAVSVSAIPEGLLVAITVILIVGMQRILQKKALVRKLVAAETLGSTSIICVDKTGTLTEGSMHVERVFTLDEEVDLTKQKEYRELVLSDTLKELITYTALCNNAIVENPTDPTDDWKLIGSPTEKAILGAALRFNVSIENLKEKFPRLDEVPFDSFNKMMTTTHQYEGGELEIRKGAPEKILQICKKYRKGNKNHEMSEETKVLIEKTFVKYSVLGYRLIASCYKQGQEYVFLGLFIIRDPIRPSVKETIKLAKRAGLQTIMITGDHSLTARSIAKEIGLKVGRDSVITGEELNELSEDELIQKIKNIKVYARVTPTHKLRIVSAWQKLGHVVAMTGDGVNDAPALKAADIGVAVGNASDVTKETADLILLDSNFSVMIEAIRQGRIIFVNIKKVIVYLLADSFSEVILVLGSLMMGLPLPITAAQILWINLITDGFPAAALTVEKSHDDVMKEKPRPKKAKILDPEMRTLIFIIGIVTDFVLLALFWKLYHSNLFEIEYIRTIMFAALGLDSLLYVFSCKSLHHSVLKAKIWENKYLLLAVGFGLLLQLVALYVPFFRDLFNFRMLGVAEWTLIIILAVFQLFLIELTKYFFSKKQKKSKIWNF